MAVTGIDHWVMVVGDLDRTLGFYERLGFTIAWEKRPNRPDTPTIRIGAAQKINVHARAWPEAPVIWARDAPRSVARTSASSGRARWTKSSRDPDENLVELTVYAAAT